MADEEKKKPEEGSPASGDKDLKTDSESKDIKSEETDESQVLKKDDTDYKEELEKEKDLRKKAEDKIIKMKEIKKRHKDEDEDDNERDETIFTREDAKGLIKESTDNIQRSFNLNQARTIARSISQNDDEFELIIYHFNNTVSPSGDLVKDIKRAKLIANEGRIEKDKSELARALKSKGTISKGGGAGQKLPKKKYERPQLSKEDEAGYKRMKAKWDGERNGWVLPSGRFYPYTPDRGFNISAPTKPKKE